MNYEAENTELVIQAELFMELHEKLEAFLEKAGVTLGERDRLFELDQGEMQAVLQSFQSCSYDVKMVAEYKGYTLNDYDPDE
jgi:hypothetical protein